MATSPRTHPALFLLLLSQRQLLPLGAALILIAGICASASGIELVLQPEGPLSSLIAARDAVRAARALGDDSPARIRVAGGVYRFESPLLLEPGDSKIRFEAEPGAHPRFLGSRQIRGWIRGLNGQWLAKVDPAWGFEALWVNGRRATRARTPNEGFLQAVGQPTQAVPGVPLAGPASKTLIAVAPEDSACLQRLTPEQIRAVQVMVYQSWDASRLSLAGSQPEEGTLQFTGGFFEFFSLEPWHRLRFENYLEALDAPGEWFLEADGTLHYLPLPGEDMAAAVVEAPVAEQWIVLKGQPEKDRWVTDIAFHGLSFEFQNWHLPPEGLHAGQAAAGLKLPAIEAAGVRGLHFEDCELAHTMTHAVWLRGGCSHAEFRHCRLQDLGAGGIYVGDPGVKTEGPQHTHHVLIEDCILRGGGRHFPAGIGVTLFHASDSTIRHCDIGDFFYSATSLGWTWGYAPTVAGRNTVENCHLHHLGWGVLSDMAAVYTLGSQIGTVIRNNHIHDIACASYGAWGLYNDEGSTGVLWENNLIHDTQSGGYHQHYGRGNIVRNNIFAWGRDENIRRSKSEEAFAFAFERNIVLMGSRQPFAERNPSWLDGRVFLADNVYWHADGPPPVFAGKTWSEWQALGNDVRSVIADPLFHDASHGDWTLSSDSPALKLGFQPFDWQSAGVRGDTAWQALARDPLPPMKYGEKPKPPLLQLRQGFELFQSGARAAVGRRNPGKPSLFVVEGIPGAQGKCLELRDGPEELPSHEPHFYFDPNHQNGVTRISFDLRTEPGYKFVHEWRDHQTPYQTSIALSVEGDSVKVAGRKLADFPPNHWGHFEIESNLGGREWSLTLTLEGGTPQRFDALPVREPTTDLRWVGFISSGTTQARAWLDNIHIEPRK